MRFGGFLIAIAGIAGRGCGDNAVDAPKPLVADPNVETGCLGPVAAGKARAKIVACDAELIGGRLASGRIGDFVIENDKLRVIIRGPGDGYYLHGSSGGGIVDAAVVGGEDLVKEIFPAVDFAVGANTELVITEAGDDAPAEIVVRGPATALDIISASLGAMPPPVIIEHHYRLAAGATALELETRVFATGELAATPTLYDAMFLGGRAPAYLPGHGWSSGQGGATVIATAGTTTSYGLVYPAGTPDPQIVDLGGIRLVIGPSIDVGQHVTRWLVLGDGSVSSVTARGWALHGTPLGTVVGTTAPNVDVEILDGAGASTTIARADSAGGFAASVPPGAYTLRAEATGRAPAQDVAVTVVAGQNVSAVVPAGASGAVAISVTDDAGLKIPARVMIDCPGTDRRIEWIGASGEGRFAIAPAVCRISISRGLEYDAFVATPVTIVDGQTVPLAVILARVVDTAGWISLDTHLHSELSTDSTFPIDDRLRAVAAEGVEVPVSSDHDIVVDYAPIIAELGLADWLGSMTGEESSSMVWGHVNAWPLAPDAGRTGGGAPRWLRRSPTEVFTALRGSDPSRIVQINHPHYSPSSFFEAIDLDPSTLTARRDPTELGLPASTDLSDLDFDAVEVANGLAHNDFDRTFADWLALVAAGHRAAATGSSDSHAATAFAGEARTYVWVGLGADDPKSIDPGVLTDAIRARHVVVGSGAFVTAGIVSGAGVSLPGDTVDVTGMSQVTLHVRVQAAGWQPLSQIRIFEKTHVVKTIPLDAADTAAVRYDADVVLPAPTADTFWVVRVDCAAPGDPVLRNSMPAFTNPVFAHVHP